MRHLADHEERRLDALRGEDVEDLIGIRRQRAVVEGDDDFLVVQRQRVRILHAAELLVVAEIDRQHAAGAERVGISGTGLTGVLRLVLGVVRSLGFVLIRRLGLALSLSLDLRPGPGPGVGFWARADTAASGRPTAVASAAATKPALNLCHPPALERQAALPRNDLPGTASTLRKDYKFRWLMSC